MNDDKRLEEIRKGLNLGAESELEKNVVSMGKFLMSEIDRLKGENKRINKSYGDYTLEHYHCQAQIESLEAENKELKEENDDLTKNVTPIQDSIMDLQGQIHTKNDAYEELDTIVGELEAKLKEAEGLLSAVIVESGGIPDLFGPDRGWDEWFDDAEKVLKSIRDKGANNENDNR